MLNNQLPNKVISSLSEKKILILGLGKEGKSSYQFLRSIFPEKTLGLADQRSLQELGSKWQKLIDQDDNLDLKLGPSYLESLNDFQLIMRTPGISFQKPALQQALESKVVFSSNLQLLFKIVRGWRQNLDIQLTAEIGPNDAYPSPLIIGVTGTKGKSTTSAIIHRVLATGGLNSVLLGNIGIPALDQIDKIKPDSVLVIEMSSHQLDRFELSPDISVIQKVTSEHLDYYATSQAYLDSKKAITKHQANSDLVITNPIWKKSKQIADLSPGSQLYFNLQPQTDFDSLVYIKYNKLIFNYKKQEQAIIEVGQVPLLGRHNLYNLMPAVIIGKMLGLEAGTISTAIQNFQPLPHRLELVVNKNGVRYYNDSMATMPDAAVSALNTFSTESIILLAGGHERNQDFSRLAQKIINSKVKSLILFPPTGSRIWKQVRKELGKREQAATLKHCFAETMEQAIATAADQAKPGDIVLLSPGAASFGVFKNYQDRGEQFRQQVKKL